MAYDISTPEQWLVLYGDILYRYALARVRDSSIAEDMVQETLLGALKSQAGYTGQASESTWLIGILKHKIIDYFRKTSRENTQNLTEQPAADPTDDYFDQQGEWQVDLSVWSKPEKAMEQNQFMQTLQGCIDNLPPRMAQIFILRELDGMACEEICAQMSVTTPNNLWVILSRARMQLRHCLDINWLNK